MTQLMAGDVLHQEFHIVGKIGAIGEVFKPGRQDHDWWRRRVATGHWIRIVCRFLPVSLVQHRQGEIYVLAYLLVIPMLANDERLLILKGACFKTSRIVNRNQP